MRKIPYIALALTATTLYGQDYSCTGCDLIFQAEYAYLHRGGIRDFPLVKDTTTLISESKVLDTEELVDNFGCQSAIRGGILYNASICSTLELLYTYIMPWHTKKTITNPAGVLSYPFKDFAPVAGFVNAHRVIAKYQSWLQNGEFNYWIHWTPQYINYFSFSWDMGLRYIQLEEHFSLRFFKSQQARYAIKTGNNLYGIQLGAMLEINPTDYWTWSFQLKGAAFVNQAHNHVMVFDPSDPNAPPGYSKHKLDSTGLIEGYAQLAYHMSSFMSLHIGYQGFLLFGLALAPEQRALTSRRIKTIKTTGQIVINGVYAGVSLRF